MKLSSSTLGLTAWASLGVAVLGTLLISRHNALPARGSSPLPLKTLPAKPILQVELGRSDRDLQTIFLPAGADLAALMQNIRDARIGNNLDTFVFIPAYTVLLMSLGLLLARTNVTRTVVLVCVAAVPVAAICDWAENRGIAVALDHLQADKAPQPGDAKRISNPSIVKWALLALVLLTYAVIAIATRRMRWVAVGLICFSFGVATAYTLGRYLLALRQPDSTALSLS